MSAVQAESCCAVERREGLCCLMLESSLGRKKRFLPEHLHWNQERSEQTYIGILWDLNRFAQKSEKI